MTMGFDNNTIQIFDSQAVKKNSISNINKNTFGDMMLDFWYLLLGGSSMVVPKSFIKFNEYEGFHLLQLTESIIVGGLGNMLRIYSFSHNMDTK
jgi:hypothetical protein